MRPFIGKINVKYLFMEVEAIKELKDTTNFVLKKMVIDQ